MDVIRDANVNGIYYQATRVISSWQNHGEQSSELHRRPSRYGDVIEFTSPVATVYEHPWQCVLLDPGRNAHPFFHFMEALWLLAGRNDVAFVARYLEKYKEFSDDGVTIHDAYGYRWRRHFVAEYDDLQPPGAAQTYVIDQLEECIQMLQKNHDERRAVLAMWDPLGDLGRAGKAFPCNTHVYLKVREGRLIATVCCRSNDLVWGAYGANAVQFAFLMQYVAERLGVPVGRLTQISDSLHVYTKVWDTLPAADYPRVYPGTRPLCDAPEAFIAECEAFCNGETPATDGWFNRVFPDTAIPMRAAWNLWKAGGSDLQAIAQARQIAAPDWREACVAWLQRAAAKRVLKETAK